MKHRRAVYLLIFSLALSTACGSTENPPEDPQIAMSDCPEFTGIPLEHSGFLTGEETWGPGYHLVTSSVVVGAGAKLTIEPCAVVRIAADQNIQVDDESLGLKAVGVSNKPIIFERADAANAWGALVVFAPATVHLEHAILRGGGTNHAEPLNAEYAGATLAARNLTSEPADLILLKNVDIENSSGLGVMLVGAGFMSGSTNLNILGSGSYPIYLGAGNATNLPTGNYVDNGEDAILLQSVGPASYDNIEPILRDATLPNRGLAYLVGIEGTYPSISVGDGREESPMATLRIEAGVELRFQGRDVTSTQLIVRGKPQGADWVAQGILIAEGTAEQPIILTSAEANPQPGDWQGLYFKNVVAPQTSLSHVHISYAGGESVSTGLCVASIGAENNDADCSVILWLDVPPSEQFITNSVIENGKGCGFYRAWKDAAVDFLATNTLTNLSGCDQSNVFEEMNGCVGSCE